MIGRSARAPARAPLLAALLGLATGCRATPPSPHVESVRIAETALQTAAEVGLEPSGLEAAARAALGEAGFRLDAGEPSYRARVEILLLRVGPAPAGRGQRVDLRVELELTPGSGGEAARREQGGGGELVGADGPTAAARRALAGAVGEAARGLKVGFSAERKPLEALLADLESSDVRVRDQAVQVLGERRDVRAVPGLVKRLQDADRQVVDHAIGALSQLRDPRAVSPLIELSRGTDAAIALRLVPVVGELGGPDAEGWLLTLEQAHPDPRVRQAAAEALRGLPRPGGEARK